MILPDMEIEGALIVRTFVLSAETCCFRTDFLVYRMEVGKE